MEILKMDEPIPKVFMNTKSLDSSLLTGSNKTNQQPTEMEKLKKQLLSARGENLTLRKELAAAMKEESENREKIAELTKKIKDFEKIPCSPRRMITEPKQEASASFEQKIKNLENKNKALEEKLKRYEEERERNREKQNIIEMQRKKIQELEELMRGREKSCQLIDKIGDANVDGNEMEFQKVMHEYDEFLRKVLMERQILINEKNTAQKHLANLETAFNDLLQKYERAKQVVQGFKNNEEILKKQIEDLYAMINELNKKYNGLRTYAEEKISEANAAILKKDKINIEEVAKLKAKILQSQVKINDLEKQAKTMEKSDLSIFSPLKSNLKKKN